MEIAIISGKGGTGKSCISAALATLDEKVILSDCDTDAANLYLLFDPEVSEEIPFAGSTKAVIDQQLCDKCGICFSYCRFDAIKFKNNEFTINKSLCDGCNLCVRVCPFVAISTVISNKSRLLSGDFRNGYMVWGRLAPAEENTGKLVSLVRSKSKEALKKKEFNTIILDGPPGTGCPVAATITGSDKIVIVTEPTLSALSDLKRLIESIRTNSRQVMVIVNKYDLNNSLTDQIEAYCLNENIIVAGKLPYDPEVVKAMVNCKTMPEWAPDSEFTIRIKKIFEIIKGFDQQEWMDLEKLGSFSMKNRFQ